MGTREEPEAHTCPGCGNRVDRLRAPAVSVVNGRITHFCSKECRETYLQRSPSTDAGASGSPAAEEESAPVGAPAEVFSSRAPELVSANHGETYRSKLLTNQFVQVATLVTVAAGAALIPPPFSVGIVGIAVAALIALVVWRERRVQGKQIAESVATPVAAASVLTTAAMGMPMRIASATAALILLFESLGRLAELAGRRRSGVLDTVEGDAQLLVPSSWRDNSETAAKVKQLAIALGWLRYPIAVLVSVLVFLVAQESMASAVIAGATALLAVNPRTLRMATGDAHLSAALWASTNNVTIRDAHAVDSLARSQSLVFLAKYSLLKNRLSVVDWQPVEGVDERIVIDALHASEASAEGAVASAVRRFTDERNARASSPCPVEVVPNMGIVSETPFGEVVCGARALLLSRGISTALLEKAADSIESSGRRTVFMSLAGHPAAVFGIEEKIVPNADVAATKLSHLGVEPVMAIGFDVNAAQALGTRLNISRVYFGQSDDALQELLEQISATGERAAVVGHGSAFEELTREALVAMAYGSPGPTQAGINVRHQDILVIPWLVQVARRARLSATLNLIAGIGTVLFGLGFAASWSSPAILAGVAAVSSAAAAATTWNAPYPMWDKLVARAKGGVRKVKQMVVRRKSRRR